MRVYRLFLEFVFPFFAAIIIHGQESTKPHVPIGVFLGWIEEGARIFTPVRLLPFDHPEAEGHQFPNALQLYGTELHPLLWLGHQAGYDLRATITRCPKQPSPTWPCKEFSLPDTANLRFSQCIRQSASDSPLKGLRAVLFVNRQPACFIVDTRKFTLEERGMTKPTTTGLDINRSDFMGALEKAAVFINSQSTAAVVFGQ